MNILGGPQIRRLRVILPEDNESEAANAMTAQRSPGDVLKGHVEVISTGPLKIDGIVKFEGDTMIIYYQSIEWPR